MTCKAVKLFLFKPTFCKPSAPMYFATLHEASGDGTTACLVPMHHMKIAVAKHLYMHCTDN